jgi:hypothetical protein
MQSISLSTWIPAAAGAGVQAASKDKAQTHKQMRIIHLRPPLQL